MHLKYIFTLLFYFLLFPTWATNYYFSATGNNSNTGINLNQSWFSLNKLNSVVLMPGDSILLKKGDSFIGEINIEQSGTDQNPIVISTYGFSDLNYAMLSGATSVSDWTETTNNPKIFSRPINLPVRQLYANDKLLILARYPNGTANFLTASAKLATGQTTAMALTQATDYWKGATLRANSINWVWEVATVKSFSNKVLYFTDSVRYQVDQGKPFYLENKLELLDYPEEWFYDNSNRTLLYYPVNKNELETSNIKAVIYNFGITLGKQVTNIKISNIHFDKFADFGVHAPGDNSYISIENCVFQNIGKIAIKLFRKSHHCTIANNYIKDVLGRAISLTECWNNEITNNIVKNIGLVPGQGISGVNGCTGIVEELRDETYDRKYDTFDTIAHHNNISHNFIDSCGYIGLRVDGAFNTAERNIIDHSMLHLDDGGGLYCYNSFSKSSIIRNNFVYNSSTQGSISNGIYIDNKVFDMKIEGNTVVNNAGSGILINAEAHDNFVLHNVLFGNGNGICFSDWLTNPIIGNKVFGNKLISLGSAFPTVLLNSNYSRYNMAEYDSNYYVNPFSTKIVQFNWSVKKTLDFAAWQNEFPNNDIHSKALTKFSTPPNTRLFLFTNKSDTVRIVNLSGCSFIDLDNNPVNELRILPYHSEVLINNEPSTCADIVSDPPYLFNENVWATEGFDRNIFADSTIIPNLGGVTTIHSNTIYNFQNLHIYPNPVKAGEVIYIEGLDLTAKYSQIELYDLTGHKIKSANLLMNPNTQFQIPNVPAGVYIIGIHHAKGLTLERIVVQ